MYVSTLGEVSTLTSAFSSVWDSLTWLEWVWQCKTEYGGVTRCMSFHSSAPTILIMIVLL